MIESLIANLVRRIPISDSVRIHYIPGQNVNRLKVSIEVFSDSDSILGEFTCRLDWKHQKSRLHIDNVAVKASDGVEYEKLVGPNFEDFVKSSKRKGRHPNNDTQDGITESLRLLLSDDSSNLNTEVVLALFVKLNNQIKSLKREIELLQVELQPNQTKEDIMDIQGAMGFLGLKKSTIYSKVNRKELPYMKIGKRLYFSRNELEGFLKDARFVSDQEIEKKAQNYFKKD